jgi:hypothetical protein
VVTRGAMMGGGMRLADKGRSMGRVLGDMHGAAADDRTAAGAGAQFRQSHSNRHSTHPVVRPACTTNLGKPGPGGEPAWPDQMQQIGARASS